MIDLHLVEHHALAAHHVVVIVGREVRVQAVGGLGAFTVTDVVGQDEEIFCDVEHPAGNEEHVGEQRVQQRVRIAAGAVQQKHGVIDVPGRIAVGRAQCEVVQLEFGKRFACAEVKIRKDHRAIFCGPGGCLGRSRRGPARGDS